MWLTGGVIPFYISEFAEKLQPEQNTAASKAFHSLQCELMVGSSWWALLPLSFSALEEVSYFLQHRPQHLIFDCCRVKFFIKNFWGFTDHGLGPMCHNYATFPVKTSSVPCPRQARTFSGFQGKVTISSLSPGVWDRDMDRLCLFGEILSLLPLGWKGIHLVMCCC